MTAKKEHKFLVLKWDDIHLLTKDDKNKLEDLVEQVNLHRIRQGKGPDNKYIVCNQDEPYAEKVWQTILKGEDDKELKHDSNRAS